MFVFVVICISEVSARIWLFCGVFYVFLNMQLRKQLHTYGSLIMFSKYGRLFGLFWSATRPWGFLQRLQGPSKALCFPLHNCMYYTTLKFNLSTKSFIFLGIFFFRKLKIRSYVSPHCFCCWYPFPSLSPSLPLSTSTPYPPVVSVCWYPCDVLLPHCHSSRTCSLCVSTPCWPSSP